MVSCVQAVCSSAAAMAWAASARAERSTSSAAECAWARTCSASASTVWAWVSASLRSASASCAASARTAAASSSAEIRSSSAARTVSSCCWRIATVAMVSNRRVSAPVVATASVGLEPGLHAQSLGLGAGRGQLLGGDGSVALGGLGGLAEDAVALGLRGLQQHPNLLARVGDRLAGLPRGVGEPGLGLGERAGRGVAVGGGLVVEAARLGLEHLGHARSPRRPAAPPGCAARRPPAGHAAAAGQQRFRAPAPRSTRRPSVGRSPAFRSSGPCPADSPPTGSVPRRLAYPRSILRERPGV